MIFSTMCSGLPSSAALASKDAALGLAGLVRDLVGRDVVRHRRRACDVQGDLAGELEEVVVARDEVRLALDLDHHADLAVRVDVGGDRALRRRAPAPLRGGGLALHAKDLDGLVHVAGGLDERALGVHHRGAGALAERLDVCG